MTIEMRLAQLHTASTETVTVTVTNASATGGNFLTPVFTSLHDGSFDLFNVGAAASIGLERIAEDGAIAPLVAEFGTATNHSGVTGIAGSGPIAPGQTVIASLAVDNAASQRFFTYASMIIPSNDAFIGNGNPEMFALFTADGRYTGPVEFTVTGARVWDAGTEVNTEEDAAFLNQTGPNTGETEGGVVQAHSGFNGSAGNPDGAPVNILSGNAVNAAGLSIDPTASDFTLNGGANPLAHFTIELVEFGADGRQTLQGDAAANTLYGGADADVLHGGQGDDALYGETGADRLYGGEGRDTLIGGQGKDLLEGGADDDNLSGGAAGDVLRGGSGDDILAGGEGADRLTGGADADLFVVGNGRDTITDFDAGEGDLILLAGDFDLSAVLGNVRDTDDGALIRLGQANSITLVGVDADDISAEWFLHLGGEGDGIMLM